MTFDEPNNLTADSSPKRKSPESPTASEHRVVASPHAASSHLSAVRCYASSRPHHARSPRSMTLRRSEDSAPVRAGIKQANNSASNAAIGNVWKAAERHSLCRLNERDELTPTCCARGIHPSAVQQGDRQPRSDICLSFGRPLVIRRAGRMLHFGQGQIRHNSLRSAFGTYSVFPLPSASSFHERS
jgi:hypothetical protein